MIQLDLQPGLEAQLTAKAQNLGLSTVKYVEQIVLSKNEEDDHLQEGLDDIATGRTRPAREVFAELHARYDIHG
ncbi:hypothetical protein [Granulicella tundricola]|uniref:Antitoxin n=1 Tax=Granulicella tundricola (strain ATCC BAA-1859 / DSM 23138 / MP5ACTX9) TaxID=1198114 RepID=E8WX34_GRATM|nr:hypothetical protein [Granulicella tundricola]ADW68595.1 hypothetical protein AciX9_1542 [Granulicella tundricola MP5ACTX9]